MFYFPYDGDQYLNYEAVEKFCYEIAEQFPQWVSLHKIGKTKGNHTIYLIAIGNHQDNIENKPAIWIDGGTHCAEWTGIMAILYTVSKWIKALDNNEDEIVKWFNSATAYIVPCISPDGFEAMMNGSPFIRSSLRESQDNQLIEGFEASDVNNDGHVYWMRWKHPAGPFVIDEDLPILMRPRTIDDAPEEAYFCTFEGEFTHWDGVQKTAAPHRYGLDLNRNFPSDWKPFNMFGTDGGDFPLSEPESNAVVTAFSERPHICAALTNHTYGGCILTQPYRLKSELKENDIELMYTLANQLVEGTGYRTYKVYPEFMYKLNQSITGVWSDSITNLFGVPGYTVEFWNLFNYVGKNDLSPLDFLRAKDANQVRETLKSLIDKHPEIVRSWQPFEHHQLGHVEIGGIDYMRSVRNPPESVLQKECEVGYAIANRIRKAIPKLQCSHTIEKIESNLFKVTAILENSGFLPTSGLKHGEGIRTTPQVTLSLEAPQGCELISGKNRQQFPHLNGWGNTMTEDGFGKNPIYPHLSKTGHHAVASWIVRGAGLYQLFWTAGKAGTDVVEVEVG